MCALSSVHLTQPTFYTPWGSTIQNPNIYFRTHFAKLTGVELDGQCENKHLVWIFLGPRYIPLESLMLKSVTLSCCPLFSIPLLSFGVPLTPARTSPALLRSAGLLAFRIPVAYGDDISKCLGSTRWPR